MRRINLSKKSKIPPSFQGILWSKNVQDLDLEKDKVYIIHQVLSFGSLKQIKWLFKVYGSEKIRRAFLESPKKIYSAAVFNFVKNFILDLRDQNLSAQEYVKTKF